MERPELLFGSVEYVATKDYCKVGLCNMILRVYTEHQI